MAIVALDSTVLFTYFGFNSWRKLDNVLLLEEFGNSFVPALDTCEVNGMASAVPVSRLRLIDSHILR